MTNLSMLLHLFTFALDQMVLLGQSCRVAGAAPGMYRPVLTVALKSNCGILSRRSVCLRLEKGAGKAVVENESHEYI